MMNVIVVVVVVVVQERSVRASREGGGGGGGERPPAWSLQQLEPAQEVSDSQQDVHQRRAP